MPKKQQYDPKKDKLLATFDLGDIRITVHSYNKGHPKIGFSRAYTKNDETLFGKAGRLSKEEFEDITDPKFRKKMLKAIEDAEAKLAED